MARVIKLKKGYDIKLVGKSQKSNLDIQSARLYALKPTDFKSLVPRMIVEEGNEVKAGDPIFHDKADESVIFASPVSGEIAEVVRGAKRKILEIRILADAENSFKDFGKMNPNSSNAEDIKNRLLESGCWTLIRQRPFNRVPQTSETPKNIFISAFDSAPYAADVDYLIEGEQANIQTAVDTLSKLTEGKVYVGLSVAQKGKSLFEGIKNVEITYFDGPHPAGNVGIQIHHTAPINKDEVVWTVSPQNLITIGRLFNDGIYNTSRKFALAGAEAKKTGYFTAYIGMQVSNAIESNLSNENSRIISGNPLTGDNIGREGFIGTFHNTVSVIEEGEEPEFMGWLFPSYKRPSLSRTFTSFMHPSAEYKVNTNMHGEERAFVMTGEYEKVLPMDVYPLQLIKACYTFDLDNMEALGIYEVVEEDIALCEFICTSKMPLQQILREGIEFLEKEL